MKAVETAQHTPGPWRYLSNHGDPIIRGPLHADGSSTLVAAMGQHIERLEDGLLISAAPEMLEALKFVDRLYSTIGGLIHPEHYGLIANSSESGKMIGAVRAAIAKAKGDL